MEVFNFPRIIHQIWSGIDEPLPKRFESLGKTWKYDYPTWTYEFWDNKRMNAFVEQRYPQYWVNYCKFPYDIQRWDAIRYLILKEMGGMYVDFDYESIQPLEELVQNKTCCFSMEPASHYKEQISDKAFIFNNALMISIPNHEFINRIVEKIFLDENVNIRESEDKVQIVFKTTGPFILNQLYNELTHEVKDQIYLIPSEYVSPFDYKQAEMIRHGVVDKFLEDQLVNAYAVHYYLGAWIPEKKNKDE